MQITKLKEPDLYSILLFALYRLSQNPDYAVLSQLMFIFDSETLLKICSQLGGLTITIPKVSDLKNILAGLNYFYKKDVLQEECEEAVPNSYEIIKQVMKDYGLR